MANLRIAPRGRFLGAQISQAMQVETSEPRGGSQNLSRPGASNRFGVSHGVFFLVIQTFDLFGDPVREYHPKGGRPVHVTPQENRNKTSMLLAFG